MFFLVPVCVFNCDLFEFSAAILEKGLLLENGRDSETFTARESSLGSQAQISSFLVHEAYSIWFQKNVWKTKKSKLGQHNQSRQGNNHDSLNTKFLASRTISLQRRRLFISNCHDPSKDKHF